MNSDELVTFFQVEFEKLAVEDGADDNSPFNWLANYRATNAADLAIAHAKVEAANIVTRKMALRNNRDQRPETAAQSQASKDKTAKLVGKSNLARSQ